MKQVGVFPSPKTIPGFAPTSILCILTELFICLYYSVTMIKDRVGPLDV